MTSGPDRVWLQPNTEDYRDGWTWCWHEIDTTDVGPYVRADLRLLRVLKEIIENAPQRATGLYCSANSIQYGYRTNRKKAPQSYIFFEEETDAAVE